MHDLYFVSRMDNQVQDAALLEATIREFAESLRDERQGVQRRARFLLLVAAQYGAI